MKQYVHELRELYAKYGRLRNDINSVEENVKLLVIKQETLSQELANTRKNELSLINKIEESINRKITQDELLEIINYDEQ